jgi:hypothetical protein
MRSLGYPTTWVTNCFINGGCGARVFAHTKGQGDFVLLDELGWPWPVHDCYLNRFCPDSAVWKGQPGRLSSSLESLLEAARGTHEYREVAKKSSALQIDSSSRRDISRVEPRTRMNGTFSVVGYVSDLHPRHSPKVLAGFGGLGQRVADKVIGNRHSQITIITSELQSFSALADLRQVIVAKGDIVCADLRTGFIVNHSFFLCDRLERISIKRVSTRGRSK